VSIIDFLIKLCIINSSIYWIWNCLKLGKWQSKNDICGFVSHLSWGLHSLWLAVVGFSPGLHSLWLAVVGFSPGLHSLWLPVVGFSPGLHSLWLAVVGFSPGLHSLWLAVVGFSPGIPVSSTYQ
jgi:hypothetical protein